MNYLLDKKTKRKNFIYIVSSVFIFLILFYFRSGIWNGLSSLSHKLFRPVWVVGNNLGESLANFRLLFISKNSLDLENENLKLQLSQDKALMSNYDSLLMENANLKEIFGRTNEKMSFVLASILGRPSQSFYDTFIIDAGTREDLKVGDIVFALGNVPIGRIAEVYSRSSKVILFSNAGEKMQVIISLGANSEEEAVKNISMEIVGRGGGNFEMIMPKDLTLAKGDQAVLPGLTPYVLGVVQTTISDPRYSFQKALLVSPVNVRELKFVEVGN